MMGLHSKQGAAALTQRHLPDPGSICYVATDYHDYQEDGVVHNCLRALRTRLVFNHG
jgi:hypothetical protein